MKKIALKQVFALGVIAMASGLACAQTSSVQLYGIVDVGIRHTNNQGTDSQSLTKMVGGGMAAQQAFEEPDAIHQRVSVHLSLQSSLT